VRNANTAAPIGPAQVVMEGLEPPPKERITNSSGQIRFPATCSDGVKFWAHLPDEPRFSDPSARVACQPLVILKIRPTPPN
jgi:hypothetical protein